VISDKAENSLIKITDGRRLPSYNNARKRERFDYSFSLGERELVVLVSHKLEGCCHIVVVVDLNQSVCRILNSHFSELHRVRTEFHIKAFSLSFDTEVQFVASIRTDFVVATGNVARSLRSVLDGYFDFTMGLQSELIHVNGEGVVIMVVHHLLYVDVSLH
jgi:hypothetical protein